MPHHHWLFSAPHWVLHLSHPSSGLPEFIFLRHNFEFCFCVDFVTGLPKSHQVKNKTKQNKAPIFLLFFNVINQPVTCHIIMTGPTVKEGTV